MNHDTSTATNNPSREAATASLGSAAGSHSGSLHVGVALPHAFVGTSTDRLRALALGMEDLGYHHLSAYDHVLGAEHANREPALTGPYTQHDVFREPFVMFGFLAGLTHTLEFATSVLVLPQRQTALVAKQAGEVALLSNNRLRLGVGAGWNHVEYDALGHSFARRGPMMDEQLELLQQLWTNEIVTMHTDLHHVERAGLNPRPTQPIPLWLGGYSAPARRRAVQHGSGFIFSRPSDAARDLPLLREELAAAGRDTDDFGVDVIVHFQELDNTAKSLAALADDLEQCVELGATHVTLTGKPFANMAPDELLDVLSEFMELAKTTS